MDKENTTLRWYIVHTYSGFEKKVKQSLEERIKQYEFAHLFGDIVVPTESVMEIVRGERKTSTRKVYPGYILVQMIFNDESWHLVLTTPKVSGFVGHKERPTPLPDKDAVKIIQKMEERSQKPVPKYNFEKGEQVVVIEGPFANFHGVVDEVRPEKGKVKVLVSIFGRQTSVELEFAHVQKSV